MMYLTYYLSNGLFSIIILIILYVNSILRRGKTTCDVLLRAVIFIGIILGVFDTASWLMSGRDFPHTVVLQYISNGGGDLLIVLISFLWFLYVYEELIGSVIHRRTRLFLFSLPVIFSFLLLIATGYHHLVFYIDESNEYVRGSKFMLLLCVPFAYIIGASLLAMMQSRKEVYEGRKRDCILLASFPIFPFVGAVAQAVCFGLSLYVPCLTLSVLLIYLNQQNHNLTLDALTQINNRGQLDRYFARRFANFVNDEHTYFMLMDIDQFKNINDTYGHLEGDDALIMVADAMKKTFKQKDAFIARYGGDEFAVLMECADEKIIQDIKMNMNSYLEKAAQTAKKPYVLSISVGTAHCGMDKIHSVNDLISAADDDMFQIKKQKNLNR